MESSTFSSAVTEVMNIFSTNVLPLATQKPFVYFLVIAVIGAVIGLYARFKNSAT